MQYKRLQHLREAIDFDARKVYIRIKHLSSERGNVSRNDHPH